MKPKDFLMEVASGEHGEAIIQLVSAVNKTKCNNVSQAIARGNLKTIGKQNDKIPNSKIANSSSDFEPSGLNQESVIVDVDLLKKSSTKEKTIISINPSKEQHKSVGPTSSLLDSSTESVIDSDFKNYINGFPTSSFTQFWILLKRTFLTIIRDQTLTQMRLVST